MRTIWRALARHKCGFLRSTFRTWSPILLGISLILCTSFFKFVDRECLYSIHIVPLSSSFNLEHSGITAFVKAKENYGFGQKLNGSSFNHIYDTDDYIVDALIFYQIFRSRCLTTKENADFVYVPYFYGQANERWENGHNFYSPKRQKEKKRLEYMLYDILKPYKSLKIPMIFVTPFQLNHERIIDDGLPSFL